MKRLTTQRMARIFSQIQKRGGRRGKGEEEEETNVFLSV